MIISDLNYIQAVDANVEGGYFFGPSSKTRVDAKIRQSLNIRKRFGSTTVVIGNFAGAEATALASGRDTSTQSISFTNVEQGKSSSSSATSVSATDGFFVRHY